VYYQINRIIFCVGLCLSFLTSNATANVIYNWVTTATSQSMPGTISARIEMSDAGFAQGSANFQYRTGNLCNDANGFYPCSNTPSSPVQQFNFSSSDISTSLAFRPQDPGLAITLGRLNFSTVNLNNRLVGQISAYNFETVLQMQSDATGLWTISELGTDSFGPCRTGGFCKDAQGYWLRQASVPAPATFALLGIALFGLSVRQRKVPTL
jgi:PEP-CTERM motif